MTRRSLTFLLGVAGGLCLLRAAFVLAPTLVQLTWPTVPARVLLVESNSRHIATEIRKFSNVEITGRLWVVLYEYERAGRSFRVRAESPPSVAFGTLPAVGDTIRVRVHPHIAGRSALRPRPPFHGVVTFGLGVLLLFATWQVAREPIGSEPEAAH